MINDGFGHAAIMQNLTQPHGLINTTPHPHITCLRIKGTYMAFEDHLHSDDDLNKSELRFRAERLRDRYGMDIDDSCAISSIQSQTHNIQFSPMTTSILEGSHPSAEEVDEKLVEFLQNKEQKHSKTVLLESTMDFILDKLKSNSEKKYFYNRTFLCGSEYLGQIMKDTCLTSLSFKNTDMTNDWLFNFAKHLPTSHITSLFLPRIIDNSQTCAREDQKEDSSFTDSSWDGVECRTKKQKFAPVDANSNEKVLNNGLEYFASILKDTEISSLDFGGNRINLKMLSCSLVGSNLTNLSLRACKLQNDGLSFLARILKDTQITCLDLSENELECQSLKIFIAGLKGAKITSLNLCSNRIGVYGMNNCLAKGLKNTTITSLDISDNNFNYESLEVFINRLVDSKITSLSLKNNYISDDCLICLGRILKNTQITSLDLCGIIFNNESMKTFLASLVDTKITFLGLQSNCIDIDELDILSNVIGNTRITSIDLHKNVWNLGDGINRLERILTNPQITSIIIGNSDRFLTNPQITSIIIGNSDRFSQFASSLMGSNITHLGLKMQVMSIDQLKCFGNVLKNSKISSLDLSYDFLDNESFKIFVPFLVDSKITSLDLSGNILGYDGINYLGSVLKNTNIISLSLSNCFMTCNEVKNFVMYLPGSKIKSLDLSHNVICCNSFYIAFILKHTQITNLDISSQNVYNVREDVDPVYLLHSINRNHSTSLHLFDNHFCTADWYFLARNLSKSEIISLTISSCEIDNEDLKYLTEGLLNSQVVNLDLTNNKIDCSGARNLAEVLKHTKILSLNLARNKIENEGLKCLMEGLAGSQLKSLDLRRNSIYDEGVQGLVESLADTQLVELDLRDNSISSGAAYRLSEILRKSNLNSMLIQIDVRDEAYVCLNLFKYQNCFIEINELISKKGVADFVKKIYKKAEIAQLILEGDNFSHLAGAFDNMNINNVCVFVKKTFLNEDAISCLVNSNIGELEIYCCQLLSPNLFEKMKVIALKLPRAIISNSVYKTLQLLSFIKSNIVYLDLSNNEIRDIDFHSLVDVFPGSQIISLNLSCNVISERCIQSLASVLPDTNITYINLDCNRIGFLGFKCLMNVVNSTKLCWLSLENNDIEKDLLEDSQLSPYIVPRIDNPIEFQIRYLFKELVTLNSSTEQFEFIIPRDDSHTNIIHYPCLVKHLLDTPINKMHIYDYFYMQSKRHSVPLLNSINAFVEQIKANFITFFESKVMEFEERFGYDSFVSLVKECNSLNLTDFVEFLLLHRVLYYVDDERNFLHPFIYKMLHEHQMPLYISELERNKKQQIISYFEKHSDFDEAQEIIDLLK